MIGTLILLLPSLASCHKPCAKVSVFFVRDEARFNHSPNVKDMLTSLYIKLSNTKKRVLQWIVMTFSWGKIS
jgi:hypothetical protein